MTISIAPISWGFVTKSLRNACKTYHGKPVSANLWRTTFRTLASVLAVIPELCSSALDEVRSYELWADRSVTVNYSSPTPRRYISHGRRRRRIKRLRPADESIRGPFLLRRTRSAHLLAGNGGFEGSRRCQASRINRIPLYVRLPSYAHVTVAEDCLNHDVGDTEFMEVRCQTTGNAWRTCQGRPLAASTGRITFRTIPSRSARPPRRVSKM